VLAAPAASRAKMNEHTSFIHHRSRRSHPAFPARQFTVYFALPGDRALLPPSFADCSTTFAPASGRQDHTTSPSALLSLALHAKSAQRHHRVHRIPRPSFVTMAIRPSVIGLERGEVVKVICPTAQADFFSREGWTRIRGNCPSGKSALVRYAKSRVRPTIGDGKGNGNYAVRFCPIASNCAFCSLLSVA
jgi:hypothetical protein